MQLRYKPLVSLPQLARGRYTSLAQVLVEFHPLSYTSFFTLTFRHFVFVFLPEAEGDVILSKPAGAKSDQ